MLANERQLSPSTQKQALSALQFLYQEVLALDMPCLHNITKPKVQARISCVLTTHEVSSALAVLNELNPLHGLMAKLLYGTGMCITEAARLHVKDLDFDQGTIVVREDKGNKKRRVMMPNSLRSALEAQLQYSQALWLADREAGVVGVELPTQKLPADLEQEDPQLSESWPWFWVFPLATLTADRHTKVLRRQPVYVQTFRRALALALRRAGVTKPDNPHTLRHTFAAHLLQRGCDKHTVQILLGKADLNTVVKGTPVPNVAVVAGGVESPLDALHHGQGLGARS
jgi:site-specific recombinase XerD